MGEQRPRKPKTVRLLRSGQMTIPIEFRRELGIEGDSLLEVELIDGGLQIRPLETQTGSAWLKELYDYFEPVRNEIRESGISREELYDLIDDAVRESRDARFGKKESA